MFFLRDAVRINVKDEHRKRWDSNQGAVGVIAAIRQESDGDAITFGVDGPKYGVDDDCLAYYEAKDLEHR